jgi:hypothetical protein
MFLPRRAVARELPVHGVVLLEQYSGLLLAVGLAVLPLLVVSGLMLAFRWRGSRARARLQGAERLLRRPGQSLHEQIQRLWDALPLNFAALAMAGAALGAVLGAGPKLDVSSYSTVHWGIVSLVAGLVSLSGWRCLGLMRGINWHRAQLAAARAVAEELGRLVAEGCRVYHDVPCAAGGHVDHILVAPCGVFALETRCYPKPLWKEVSQEVHFDGMQLQFPHCSETKPFVRLHKACVWLNNHITEVTGTGAPVSPMLVLPGWTVLSRTRDSARVTGPQQIATYILSRPPTLSGQLFKRICDTLDDRCRTEWF